MKACPGLRSGIDRSGSLSFAIRGIPSSIRPPIRHSGEEPAPNPDTGPESRGCGEGVVALGLVPSSGRTARSRKLHHPASVTIFILLCGLRKATVTPASLHSPESMKSISFAVGAAFTGGVPAPRLS